MLYIPAKREGCSLYVYPVGTGFFNPVLLLLWKKTTKKLRNHLGIIARYFQTYISP